jgi:hypothetical protein
MRGFTSWTSGEIIVGVAVEYPRGAIVVSTTNDRIIKLEQTESGLFAPMLGISAMQAQSIVAHEGIYLLQGEGLLTAITNDTADVLGMWRYPSGKEWTANCIIGEQLLAVGRRPGEKNSELWEFPMAGIGKKHGGLQPALT